ncbi:MAG: glucose-6-phosphate dehydrogenase assembly protein OpcA [Chloroflexota bacterium]
MAIGTDGPIASEGPGRPGEPVLRWASRAQSIEDVEQELARIWSSIDRSAPGGDGARTIAARSSVMNLVVVARRNEVAWRCATTIQALTGRHPSRTMVVQSADPDGPSWLDARVEAHCVLPHEEVPETCAEMIHMTAGGEAGRHLAALVTPLLIHDLPVTVWWPDEPPFRSRPVRDLLGNADRVVVDGSTWSGDGLQRLIEMAETARETRLTIRDFALVRQSRWREAIASIFDDPDFLPYLHSLRRIAVTYATHDETGAVGSTNLVKPVYHVAWLSSALGMTVRQPLAPVAGGAARAGRSQGSRPAMDRGLAASLTEDRHEMTVVVRPVASAMPAGTTLRVELLAERRGSELRADVTAEAELVRVRIWQDGVEVLDRHFTAPRRTDVDLLSEAIESGAEDPVARGTLQMAAELAGGGGSNGRVS